MAGRVDPWVPRQFPRDVAVEGGVRGARGSDDRQEVPMTARTARAPHRSAAHRANVTDRGSGGQVRFYVPCVRQVVSRFRFQF